MNTVEKLQKELMKHLNTVGLTETVESGDSFCDCPDEILCKARRDALCEAIRKLEGE